MRHRHALLRLLAALALVVIAADAGYRLVFSAPPDMPAPIIVRVAPNVSVADIAAQLGTSEGAVKVAVHRLRQRYREVLRAEIADTVASPGEVEDEIRSLFAALAG